MVYQSYRKVTLDRKKQRLAESLSIMIKKIAVLSVLTGILVGLIAWIFAKQEIALTAFVCHLLLVINMLGLWLIWRVVFEKKSVALGVAIIILKYPILGYIVVQVSRQNWFNSFGLVIGFSSFVFSIVLAALLRKKLE